MTDTYFVCFQAGTGGRFISTIVWNLINNIQKTIDFGEYNSAHADSYWALSWDPETKTPSHRENNLPTIFSTINFLRNQPSFLNPNGLGLLNTHTYPDFQVIVERFPNSKIIIISFEQDDMIEIICNNVIKNIIQTLSATNKPGDYKQILGYHMTILLQNHLGEDVNLETYDYSKMDIEPFVRTIYQRITKHFIDNNQFMKPVVPNEWMKRTTVIAYKDIFRKTTKGYYGLEILEHLTNTIAGDTIIQSYTNYVNGREKLIKEKLPWIPI